MPTRLSSSPKARSSTRWRGLSTRQRLRIAGRSFLASLDKLQAYATCRLLSILFLRAIALDNTMIYDEGEGYLDPNQEEPMEKTHLQIDGNSIAVYERGGSGAAILLIHGRSMDAKTFRHQPAGTLGTTTGSSRLTCPGTATPHRPSIRKKSTPPRAMRASSPNWSTALTCPVSWS